MTNRERDYARQCVEDGDTYHFYHWARWQQVREEVLKADKYECQICREKYNRYRKADTVHHVKHLKKHPEMALVKTYKDAAGREKRNLISLCHACHEEVHGYRRTSDGDGKKVLTEERWD